MEQKHIFSVEVPEDTHNTWRVMVKMYTETVTKVLLEVRPKASKHYYSDGWWTPL